VHVLVATKFLPLPADSGVKQRSLGTLRRLAERARVTVAGFDDGGTDVDGLRDLGVTPLGAPWPPSVRSSVGGLGRTASISSGRFWNAGLAAAIRAAAAADPVDAVFLEFPQLDPWVRRIPAGRLVFASHNVESALVASYAETRRGAARALYATEARAVRRLEAKVLSRADVVGVVSERDRDRLPPTTAPVLVCPNGWDPGPVLPMADEPVVVFVAQLGWAPNVDAATWLARSIWPLVVRERPDARLLLVGRTPTAEVQALAGPSVEVTGTVPDVRPYLARARVAVAPLRAAGGSRLKILEACDAGRPVVATTTGVEGLEGLVDRGVLVADEPAGLARSILDLLADGDRAAALGREGHDAVAARYSWDATLAPLIDATVAEVPAPGQAGRRLGG
jgi:glycosyltransferase involved in cell wall biosynthesis